MSHLSNLSAAMFADLSISMTSTQLPSDDPGKTLTINALDDILNAIPSAVANTTNLSVATAKYGTGFFAVGGSGDGNLFSGELVTGTDVTTLTNEHSEKYVRLAHIKEFPAIGTPANIVKVPVYGKKNSMQIQGQADSPTMEITLNYIPSLWAENCLCVETTTGTYKSPVKVADGKVYLFRFTLANEAPTGFDAISTSLNKKNSSYYFLGKLEALEVTPSLTDAMTAKLTIAVQSEIKGAYTIGA
jgi:hypothetical protein